MCACIACAHACMCACMSVRVHAGPEYGTACCFITCTCRLVVARRRLRSTCVIELIKWPTLRVHVATMYMHTVYMHVDTLRVHVATMYMHTVYMHMATLRVHVATMRVSTSDDPTLAYLGEGRSGSGLGFGSGLERRPDACVPGGGRVRVRVRVRVGVRATTRRSARTSEATDRSACRAAARHVGQRGTRTRGCSRSRRRGFER